MYRCRTCDKQAARHGDEVCDSFGGGRRKQGGTGVLSRPRWVHGRALQLREHPYYSHLCLRFQAHGAKIQEDRTQQLWIHGEGDDGEPEHGHDELFILKGSPTKKKKDQSEQFHLLLFGKKEKIVICLQV